MPGHGSRRETEGFYQEYVYGERSDARGTEIFSGAAAVAPIYVPSKWQRFLTWVRGVFHASTQR